MSGRGQVLGNKVYLPCFYNKEENNSLRRLRCLIKEGRKEIFVMDGCSSGVIRKEINEKVTINL